MIMKELYLVRFNDNYYGQNWVFPIGVCDNFDRIIELVKEVLFKKCIEFNENDFNILRTNYVLHKETWGVIVNVIKINEKII